MRSYASFKSHPIHPILINYPFAFLTGALGFRVAGAVSGRRELTRVSDALVPVGIAAGLAAAVPGVLDYLNSVPPDSSAHSRATTHGLVNSSALALFALSTSTGHGGARLMLQALGTAALSYAGWLGGTLVYRNQIGVDHRYADAGKWQESRALPEPDALADEARGLGQGQMKLVHSGGDRIVVARTHKGCAAFSDRCTHKGGPLSDGALVGTVVQCPWHGSQFDVETCAVEAGPATEPVTAWRIEP